MQSVYSAVLEDWANEVLRASCGCVWLTSESHRSFTTEFDSCISRELYHSKNTEYETILQPAKVLEFLELQITSSMLLLLSPLWFEVVVC